MAGKTRTPDQIFHRNILRVEKHATKLFREDVNMMVPWALIASYAYYKKDQNIFSDLFFDKMLRVMYSKWDDINHRHKGLIRKGAKSLFYLAENEYPGQIEGALEDIKETFNIEQRSP